MFLCYDHYITDWLIYDDIGLHKKAFDLFHEYTHSFYSSSIMLSANRWNKFIHFPFYDYDLIITVGEGGHSSRKWIEKALRISLEEYCKVCTLHPKEMQNVNISDKYGSKCLIIEDVVATGRTLSNIIDAVHMNFRTIDIVTAIYNVNSSSDFKQGLTIPGVCNIYALAAVSPVNGTAVYGEEGFWTPGIYSTRHLFGKDRIEGRWQYLAQRYFNNDLLFIDLLNKIYEQFFLNAK